MHTLQQILRTVLLTLLTVVGMLMAFVFMASTALAIAILYVVARVSGRPFEMRSYWNKRRRAAASASPFQSRTHSAKKPSPYIADPSNVSDIEMREIH